jgi:hypothetical protein
VLAALDAECQREEIVGNKTRLETILDRTVTSLAYPYGGRSAYTRQTIALAREAGLHRACSTNAETVRPGADWFQLPRLTIGNWNGDTFASQLGRLLQCQR